MATTRFDSISRLFASRRTARQSAAQQATPVASSWDGKKIPYLFVQSFEGGSIAPKAGADGAYTVTLNHGLGQTLYFADRPSRDVGAVPTPQFLEGLGFPEGNPPNAALLVDDGNGGTEIAVVELRNPAYDTATNTATYDVAILEAWQESTELGLTETPADLADLPETLGPVHLFIDDCADDRVDCVLITSNETFIPGGFDYMGFCYNYLWCMPCEPYGHTQPDRCSTYYYWTRKCNGAYLDDCNGKCHASWTNICPVCSEATVC